MGMVPAGPSLTYLVRIMSVLVNHGEITITNLAMTSRTNHQRCREVTSWLQDSGYADTKIRRKKRYVILTQSGYDYGKQLLDVSAMTHLLNSSEHDTYLKNAETH